jgi:hypothetical protein
MYRMPLRLPYTPRTTFCDRLPAAHVCQSSRNLRTATKAKRKSLESRIFTYIQHQQQQNPRPPPQRGDMSFLLPGLRRGLLLSTPLVLSAPLIAHQFRYAQRIRCDGPDPLTKIKNDLAGNYTSEAQTPIITQSGAVNPRAIRQISIGSILGVIGGLGISVFSKPLAVLIGLGIFILQVSGERYAVDCGEENICLDI